MCGIYGSLEHDGNAAQTVFAGLKDIEYRGYDSWGIAYVAEERIKILKDIGHLPPRLDLPNTQIALGHTRWATHGGVTQDNAHPHTDCSRSIALVHNGIVENAQSLKEQLSTHLFKSQTDTEVIAHLIEEERQKDDRPFSEIVRKVFKELEGCNALLVTNGKELVAAQKKSSLIIGRTDSGFVVSSDTNALLPHTKKLHVVENGEVVILNDKISDLDFKTVDWQYQSSDLGNFPHYTLKEIIDQPQALTRLLMNPKQIKEATKVIAKARNIFLLGCGSANHAGMMGAALLSEYGNRLTYACAASEFGSKQKFLRPEDLVIAISQSGETIDLLEQVRIAQENHIPALAILNRLGTALYREVPSRIILDAGEEKAVVATKSFTNMVATFILLSHQLGGTYEQGAQIVAANLKSVQDIINNRDEIAQIAREIAHKPHLFVLGRGLLYPIASEIALKIKEASYLHAEGFQTGELKHGVLALIEKGVPVITLTPSSKNSPEILAHVAEVKARGAYMIGVGPSNNSLFDIHFPIPATGAEAAIPKTVFGQLLSYYISLERGLNPDRPRNLAKSVTVK